MIFKFNICDCERCPNWYFDVDSNLTRRDVIKKIHEAFRNYVKNELDKDNKKPLEERLCRIEREGIDFFDNLNKLNKEFEKVGLKKFKIPNCSIWYVEDVYTFLGTNIECIGPENCQERLCDKVQNWKKNKYKTGGIKYGVIKQGNRKNNVKN